GSVLLGERSRLAGLERSGAVAPGQGCRLLPTLDGVLAVSLVRPSDWDFAPAWLECAAPDGWVDLARVLKTRTTGACLARGRLLGLAVADAAGERGGGPWFETIFRTAGAAAPRRRPPLVVDFSALWAGPLCGDLLGRLGARVIKVESVGRSDGARLGEPAFFARLNGGKASVALDFRAPQDRAALLGLIQAADIVLESSRPRALRQLGIYAEELIERTPGMTWIAISGHGRREPQGDWTGFGDDAGVAAGLSRLMKDVHGDWLFCGDAIADPLTGLHAALLAWSSWLQGGGVLQSVSLSSVVASVIAADRLPDAGAYRQRTAAWSRLAQAAGGPLYDLPVARAPVEAMGASNHLIPPC
ncbi:MAG: hypothetical protein JWQ29_1310, partial [Phenylobacterium sp.]|nr:hypothetical protein [Phenylobacterium sp.]